MDPVEALRGRGWHEARHCRARLHTAKSGYDRTSSTATITNSAIRASSTRWNPRR